MNNTMNSPAVLPNATYQEKNLMKRSHGLSVLSLTILLAGCFLLLGGAASAQSPQGFIDSGNGTTFSSWGNPTLTIGGWAAATEDTAPAASVKILIDGNVVGTVVPSIARPDVAAYLGNVAYTNSGWTFSYSVGTKYQPGGHSLAALAFDAEGNSAALTITGTAAASFTIPTPQAPQGFLDNVAASTVTQSQNIVISGWAGDPQDGAPVKQVQILMDGKSVGSATLGITRTDVQAVYPTYLKSGWTSSYPAGNLAGSHTFTAVAYDNESLSTTLTVIAQNTINVLAPDLIESISAPASAASGTAISVTDIATNQGNGVAPASATWFYLASSATAKSGSFLGSRGVPTLAVGASSTGTTTLTMPAAFGTYYVLACANASNGTFVEISTANNCSSAPVALLTPDLADSAVTVAGTPVAGGTIQVTDTVSNSVGVAPGSVNWYYLAATATAQSGTYLGSRAVPGLAQGGTNTGTAALTMPANISGTYYIVSCANSGYSAFTETNRTNNCAGSAATPITGADLSVSAVATNPASVVPGGVLAVTDTTMDAIASAAASTTRYYLSKTPTLVKSGSGAGVLLGSRSVPALAASGTSVGTVNVTVSASTATGTYYIVACANDTNTVVESNTTNNCTPTPVAVYLASNTVFVDQANTNGQDTSCGTSAIPCKTITEGLAAAKSGQTVLVNPGTYTEQITITQNVTLASTTKNTAIVQAPAVLVPDPDLLSSGTSAGQQTVLVNISGGATSAAIVNMGVRGPGPTSCGSIGYGVFVANANAIIAGNQVLEIRDNPYGGCQNGVAIRIGSQVFGFVGHTGTIAYNTVADYDKGGIVVDGAGTNVSVVGNVVTGQNTPSVSGQNGIQISRGALGAVTNNVVLNNLYASPATPLNMSADGILVYDITSGVTVTNNTVTGNDEGIGIYSDTNAATNVTVENNTVTKNIVGIHTDMFSTANTIWLNTARNNSVFDLADEHSDLSYNNWNLTPSAPYTVVTPGDANTYGILNVGAFLY